MKSVKNRKLFQKLDKILSGSDGIIYLMFLGRDTYAARIQGSLVGTIYKNNSNVNQAVNRLLKHGSKFLIFQRKHRGEKTPGRKAEIYTASFAPIFETLQAFDIDFDEKELQHALESLSVANNYFPEYLLNMFETSIVRKSPWRITLANFFYYMADLLRKMSLPQMEQTYSIFLADISIPKENVDSLLIKHPDLANKFTSMAVRMTLPYLGLNPKFKILLSETMAKLDTFQAELMKYAKFLHELKQMGITNIDELPLEMEKIKSQLERLSTRAKSIERRLEERK